MFQFGLPLAFALLPLPALIYWLFPKASNTGAALQVPFYAQISDIGNETAISGKWLKVGLLLTCWLLLVLACARPQWLGEHTELPISGRDLMLAVDVSGSMKAVDMIYNRTPENRLSAVKRVAGNFIERRVGDRIGLILFGTRAYLQAPLSLDRKTVNQLLQESAIGIAGEKTAIGDAIGLAMKRLKDRKGQDKILILLTDGTNTAGAVDPLQASRLAKLGGLRIHTIGVGADQQGFQSALGGGFFRQRSDLDEAALKQIAASTGGRYFRATDAESLKQIYELIDQLEPVEEKTSHLRPVKELFYWPLGLAFLISLIWVIGQTVSELNTMLGQLVKRDKIDMQGET
ncbi:MAG: vWA domain-containing protein [bacterium]